MYSDEENFVCGGSWLCFYWDIIDNIILVSAVQHNNSIFASIVK